jgi:hypothetical protein
MTPIAIAEFGVWLDAVWLDFSVTSGAATSVGGISFGCTEPAVEAGAPSASATWGRPKHVTTMAHIANRFMRGPESKREAKRFIREKAVLQVPGEQKRCTHA